MSKTLLALTFLSASLFASASFAANPKSEAPSLKRYELKMELIQNGKVVSTPKVVVNNGERASVTTEDKATKSTTSFEVMALETNVDNAKGVKLEFTVSYKDGNGKMMSSKPQILVKENVQGKVSVGDEAGKETFALNVTATPVTK